MECAELSQPIILVKAQAKLKHINAPESIHKPTLISEL